ncbi:hypothetical protein HETIRDRAFT_171977 [Heterobasidion irregulare TC 32-1]|uniref:Uncharacterized protein n=1 Tax=Heterobasidion irregulare (strain TC 32-1) TaxID=747525 RepID=W4K0Y5_HETIT|nr:uncharacterized protein HETIRDRAFT_171977 [Heterobasidion irregulare TC 32-1]ETW79493.1 hypothetical protein HETIRDRAFT_171977 [Heterobasidion irregulare TC 32-1]
MQYHQANQDHPAAQLLKSASTCDLQDFWVLTIAAWMLVEQSSILLSAGICL